MSSPFPGRSGADPVVLDRLAATLGSHFDEEQRVYPLGHRASTTANQTVVRFRASRACLFVTYHVQNGVGGSTLGLFTRGLGRGTSYGTQGLFARGLGVGGTFAYDPNEVVASGRVDCRSERQQEITITKDGVNRYVVYLIPEFLEADGSYTKFDGEDAEDRMAVVDIGV